MEEETPNPVSIMRLWDLATLLSRCYCQSQIRRNDLEIKALLSLTSSSNYPSPKKLCNWNRMPGCLERD